MRPIDNLNISKELILKLKEKEINSIEELWVLKRTDLKNMKLNNNEINDIIISLQLIGLDLNKRKY